MHNTDRTQQYMEAGELTGMQGDLEAPYQGEFGGQYEAPWQGEYGGQQEGEYPQSGEIYGELVNPLTGEINPEAEMNLAAELLTVNNEAELDQFLGRLVRGIGRGFRNFARSGMGRMVGSALKGIAAKALPTLGGALGTLIPIPGVGTALGAAAGNLANQALGMEGEGLSQEDREFEVARRIVRIGVESARALDGLQQGEFVTQQEIAGLIGSVAGRLLPAVGRAVLGGLTGQATSGGQATGGILGNLRVRSPGGWDVSAGGQAGGQVTGGTGIGVNAPAPNVPFQPSPPRQVLPPYGAPRGGGGGGGGGRARSGRWIRQGRNIVVLNAF